jgi:hypothetical protein
MMIFWLNKRYANSKTEIFSVYFVTAKCQKFRSPNLMNYHPAAPDRCITNE